MRDERTVNLSANLDLVRRVPVRPLRRGGTNQFNVFSGGILHTDLGLEGKVAERKSGLYGR